MTKEPTYCTVYAFETMRKYLFAAAPTAAASEMEDSVFASASSRLQLDANSALEAVTRDIETALVKRLPPEAHHSKQGLLHSRTHSHASVSADECPVCSGSISGSHTHLAEELSPRLEPSARPRSALLSPLRVAMGGSNLSLVFPTSPHSGSVRPVSASGASFELLSSHVPIRAVSDAFSASISSVDSLAADANAAAAAAAREDQRSPSGVHTVEEVNMATFRTPLEHLPPQHLLLPQPQASPSSEAEAAPLARIERQPYVLLESPRAPPVQLGCVHVHVLCTVIHK